MAVGFFGEDTRPWEGMFEQSLVLSHGHTCDSDNKLGTIISSYCSEFENLDGNGHGVKLETTNMTVRRYNLIKCPPFRKLTPPPLPTDFHPQPFTCYFPRPWRGGLDYKLATLRYRRMAAYISVTRDRDAGRVYPDPATGDLQIDYTPSVFDRAHALEGAIAVCKILYVQGARQIDSYVHGVDPFVQEDWELASQQDGSDCDEKGIKDPRFLAWLDQVRRLGANSDQVSCSSAHQMGTCRMSATEEKGVVDVHGKVWGIEDLYVADTSVFPSASGVNPMVTVMAIADWIARAVDEDLKGMKTA